MLTYEKAIIEAGILRSKHSFPETRVQYDYFELFMKGRVDSGRDSFIKRYGFAIPNPKVIKLIAQYQPILEVGCGTGYWAYELVKINVDIVATDPGMIERPSKDYGFTTQHIPIDFIDGLSALKKYPKRTLLMVWPSYNNPWAGQVLAAYSGNTFIYVGEGEGGCCADETFWEEIDKNWEEKEWHEIPQWYGINDYLAIFTRKKHLPEKHLSKESQNGV